MSTVTHEEIKDEKDIMTIGFIGGSGVGKSSLINTFMGSTAAPVGYCNTTKQITSYVYQSFILCDTPALGDGSQYIEPENLNFLINLDQRVIVIMNSLREVTSILNLFHHLSLSYIVVVNRCDQLTSSMTEFRLSIRNEMKDAATPSFFLSTKQVDQFQQEWTQFKTCLRDTKYQFNHSEIILTNLQ